jgi:hypothetical protein
MLTEIYVDVDDFCKAHRTLLQKALVLTGGCSKNYPCQLTLSEVMTILIGYHLSPYKTFKGYYHDYIANERRRDFPDLISYDRFVSLTARALLPLMAYLTYRCRRSLRTGLYFIDSTPVAVSDPHRAHQHRVFAGLARWGKNSKGWFFGFKLHLIVNNLGQIVHHKLTHGSVHDTHPKVLFELTDDLAGWVFGDRGYLLHPEKQAFVEEQGRLCLVAKTRSKSKAKDLPMQAKKWAKKRPLIETVIGHCKQAGNLEHTRHRSARNGVVNVYACLVAYTFHQRTPTAWVSLADRSLKAPTNSFALAA